MLFYRPIDGHHLNRVQAKSIQLPGMKKNTKKQSTNSQTIKNRLYKNRFLLWAILLPIITFAYDKDCYESYLSFRFLIVVSVLIGYTAFLFWAKKGKSFTFKSVEVKWFYAVGGLFLLWNLVCSVFAIHFNESLFPLARIAVFGICVFYIMDSLKGEDAIQKCLKAFTLLLATYSIIVFFQMTGTGFTSVPGDKVMPTGFTGNRNLLGGFFAISFCVPAYLAIQAEGRWKWVSVMTVFLVFAAIILSQTRTAWIAFFGILTLMPAGWVWIYGKRNIESFLKPAGLFIAGMAAIVAVIFLFAPDNVKSQIQARAGSITGLNTVDENKSANSNVSTSFTQRIGTWQQSFDMFKDYPFVGVDPGNWKIGVPIYGKTKQIEKGKVKRINAHNLYLQILSETGAIGIILFIAMFYFIFLSTFKFFNSHNNSSDKTLLLFLMLGIIAMLIDSLVFHFPDRTFLFVRFFYWGIPFCFSKIPFC